MRRETGFEFDGEDEAGPTPPPTPAELALLREAVARKMAEDYPDFARRVWRIN
ncbi:hypothetical protein D3C83_235530 [compost metagenome]